MAKVITNLFEKLSGKIAGLNFRTRKFGTIELGIKRIPFNPQTAAQLQQRDRYKNCLQQWYSLTEADKQLYAEKGKALGLSAYHAFMAECLKAAVGYSNFDNNGGGAWLYYINVPITTIPAEYAQYKIVITANSFEIYAADGTLKLQDTTSGVWSDFWTNVQSSGDDIRVFDQNKNQLYFWREEWDYTNQRYVMWVNLPANSTELNIAYGNPNALKSLYEDHNAVFEFFDDFEDADISDWTGAGISVTTDAYHGSYALATAGGASNYVYKALGKTVGSVVVRGFAKPIQVAGFFGIGVWDMTNKNGYFAGFTADATNPPRMYRIDAGSNVLLVTTSNVISVSVQYYEIVFIINRNTGELILKTMGDTVTTTDINYANFDGFVMWRPVAGDGCYDLLMVLKLADPAAFGTPQVLAF